jgi:hypothetical protein
MLAPVGKAELSGNRRASGISLIVVILLYLVEHDSLTMRTATETYCKY